MPLNPRKVKEIPKGYVKGEIIDGKQTYVLSKSKPTEVEKSKEPSKIASSTNKSNVKSSYRPPQNTPRKVPYSGKVREDLVYLDDSKESDVSTDNSTVNAPPPSKIGLYGGVDINRQLLPKRDANQPYDVYSYPDAEGRYTNTAQKKYFIDGKEIDINKSLQGSNFVPSYIAGSNINEGSNVGGVTSIMQPKDSGVNKTNQDAANLLLAGTTPTKNTYGGAGFVKPANTNDQFATPKYDKNGKPITINTTIAPSFKKGGLVGKINGYKNGTQKSGVVSQNDNYNKKSLFTKDDATDAAGSIGSSYYASQTSDNSGDAIYNSSMGAVSKAGLIGGVIGGVSAIGDAIGKPIRDKNEKIDPRTGKYKNINDASVAGAVGSQFNPFKAITTAVGDEDLSGGKKALMIGSNLLGLGATTSKMYYKAKEAASVKKINKTKEEVNKANDQSIQQQAIAQRNAGEFNTNYDKPYNVEDVMYDDKKRLNSPLTNQYMKKGGVVSKVKQMYQDGGEIKGKGTAKSDSIEAKVKEGSFVVPAENAELAKGIRKLYLKVPNKKANLKQKEGEEVKLSNGEHLFTKKENEYLESIGVNLEDLAPNAEHGKELYNGGPVKGTTHKGATWNGSEWVSNQGKYTFDKQKELTNSYNDYIKSEDSKRVPSLKRHYDRIKDDSSRKDEAVKLKKQIDELSGVKSKEVNPVDKKTTDNSNVKSVGVPKSKYKSPVKKESASAIAPITPTISADAPEIDSKSLVIKDVDGMDNTPKSKSVPRSNGLASRIGNIDPTAFVGVGQAALGLNMLGKEKRPIDNAKLDATYNANVNRAIEDAKFGLTPEQKFLAEQDIQNSLNDAKAVGLNYAGGNGVQAFNTNRAAINDAWRAKLGLKQADTEMRMNKQKYADAQAADRANILAGNRRQAFTDAMGAFQQKQQSGSELVGAGLSNLVGAYRFNQEMKNRDAADAARSSFDNKY
jgi:hypothetical protein